MKLRNLLSALVAVCLMAMAGLASAQRFVKAPIYSQGSAPAVGIASGDFNGDGNTDLAFASNTNPAVVSVRLGTGDGKFTKGQQITLSNFAGGILASDLDNDGVIDLAVSSDQGKNVSILLGRGNGTFTLAGSFAAGSGVLRMATGDLNGDGIPDIVGTGHGSTINVLLGLGSGMFSTGTALSAGTGGYASGGVVVADFNRDGKLDIAENGVNNFHGSSGLSVLLGNGDGTFRPAVIYDTTLNSFSDLAVADLNHDGLLDLVDSGDLVSVHIGNGDGTFEPAALFRGTTSYGGGVAVADWNKDGNLDILSTDVLLNVSAVLLGTC